MKNTVKMNFGILMGLVILCLGLTVLTDKFATVTNFFNVVRQITINLYLACGMTFVILLGGIDLSVGSVIAVTGCVSAGMITWVGLPVPVGILIGILCGTLVGALNGIIVSRTTGVHCHIGHHEYRQGYCQDLYPRPDHRSTG